jgi:hypothetical protein
MWSKQGGTLAFAAMVSSRVLSAAPSACASITRWLLLIRIPHDGVGLAFKWRSGVRWRRVSRGLRMWHAHAHTPVSLLCWLSHALSHSVSLPLSPLSLSRALSSLTQGVITTGVVYWIHEQNFEERKQMRQGVIKVWCLYIC